jgi:DNA-directed RNA polymerase subunit RPC12/RpoP
VIAGINDLATLEPLLVKQWSKKNKIKPTEVSIGSHKKVIWRCEKGHEWEAAVKSRTINKTGCPYCSGYIFLKEFNDLQTTHPEIASEWSEKNLPLKPDEVNAKSRKNVWWRCGNEWKSVINARVKGTVCPVCAEREVLAGYNDLATTDNQLLSEWDYEQNKLKPTEVSRTSAKRAWWKCRHGHSWSMKINERTILNKGCRICEQEYLSLFPALAVSYYSNKKGLKAELGSDRLLGVPLETYIPSEKLAIESGSADENIEIMKAYMCKQRGIRLIKLPMKGTELDYANSLKKAFQSVHIFISSDTEEDVEIIKNTFERWRDS